MEIDDKKLLADWVLNESDLKNGAHINENICEQYGESQVRVLILRGGRE
ncbi:MAG: hypothetical protein PHI12_14835 [Dehalococcoidales bacterium]|jgi:hypothetical protein|nr:hypothetical protein [Sphaerochaeta sp.]MDD5512062.1 hypothetical protein [Dehalococcoidales bacterium]